METSPDPAPAADDPIQPPEPTPIPENRTFSIFGYKVTPAEIRKALTAAVAAIAIGVTQGVIQGTAAKWAAVIISIASVAGVYKVKNARKTEGT